MGDFCNCSQCPHHCGGDEEDDTIKDFLDNKIGSQEEATKKVEALKKDIKKIGFKIKKTKDGLKVSQ
ncbi:MAG: hypothetical protein WAV31_04620 [Candidatus Moraniibacteriota bacterium]